jgi:hypothetical protein
VFSTRGGGKKTLPLRSPPQPVDLSVRGTYNTDEKQQ